MHNLQVAIEKFERNGETTQTVITEVRDQVQDSVDGFNQSVTSTIESVQTVKAAVEQRPPLGLFLPQSLLQTFVKLESKLGSLPDQPIETIASEAGAEALGVINDKFSAPEAWAFEGEGLRLWLGTFELDLNQLHDRLQHFRDNLMMALQTHFVELPEEFCERLAQEAAEWVEAVQQQLESAAEKLADSIADATSELVEHTQQELIQRLEQQAEDILNRVLEELAVDAVEHTVLAEVGTTVTATLSPILPQLIAAKLLLDEIKDLLHALRLGF
jgi:histone H3/H4